MKKKEVWRDIPGCNGQYSASTHGRVRSNFKRLVNGKILRQERPLVPMLQRYWGVSVNMGGKFVRRRVSVLVLSAFSGERPEGHQCAHLDGDKNNNCLENLAWVTPRENASHKIAHGTHRAGSRVHLAKLTEDKVRMARQLVRDGVTIREISRKFGVTYQAIHYALRGATWKHVTEAK